METTTFFILFTGVLISLDDGVLGARRRNENEENWRVVNEKDEVKPPVQSFPLLTLPSLSSFSLPGLNFPQIPYLQALSASNRLPPSGPVKVTKTEFMEVTRRLTVHPVCYTAYEAKSPCLPYSHLDFQDDEYDNGDFDAVRETHENFDLNEVRKSIQVTPTSQVTATREPALVKEEIEEEYEESGRSGRYLQFKFRREKDQAAETSSKIEGSEFIPVSIRHPNQQQTTEYFTKTVLVTKLEKYTDRRVTATLMAVNCLPVDRNIPMCQTQYQSPIKETPDHLFTDEKVGQHPEQVSQISYPIDPSQYTKQSRENENQQIDATVQAVYGAARRAGVQFPETSFVSAQRGESKIDSDQETVDENTENVRLNVGSTDVSSS